MLKFKKDVIIVKTLTVDVIMSISYSSLKLINLTFNRRGVIIIPPPSPSKHPRIPITIEL